MEFSDLRAELRYVHIVKTTGGCWEIEIA